MVQRWCRGGATLSSEAMYRGGGNASGNGCGSRNHSSDIADQRGYNTVPVGNTALRAGSGVEYPGSRAQFAGNRSQLAGRSAPFT